MSSRVGSNFQAAGSQPTQYFIGDSELDVEGGGQPATFQSKKSPGKPSRVLLVTLFMGLALAGVALCSLFLDSPFFAAKMQHPSVEGMTRRVPSATERELEVPLENLDEEREVSPFLAAMMQYRRFFRLGCKYLRMELKYRGFNGMMQGFPSAVDHELEAPSENLDEEFENTADNEDTEQLVHEEAFEAEDSVTSGPPSVDAELAQSHEQPKAPERLEAVETLADANHVVTPAVELVETQEKVEETNAAQGVVAAAFAPNNAPESEPQATVLEAPAPVKAEATTAGADETVVRQQAVVAAAKAAVTQQKTQRAARQTAPAQKPAKFKQTRRDSKRQAGRGDFGRRAGRGDSKRRAGRGDFERRAGRGDSKRRGETERRGGRGDLYRNGGRTTLEGRGKKRSRGRRGGEF